MIYFKWKLELVSNILWMVVANLRIFQWKVQNLEQPSNKNHSQPRKTMILPLRSWKLQSKSFKCYIKFNIILLVYHSYVIRMSLVCTRMSLVCTRISSVCHSHVLVCHQYVTRMYSYFIRMSLVVLVCHPYVTRTHWYVTRMSLVCTPMPRVCYLYVICMSLVSGFTMNPF